MLIEIRQEIFNLPAGMGMTEALPFLKTKASSYLFLIAT